MGKEDYKEEDGTMNPPGDNVVDPGAVSHLVRTKQLTLLERILYWENVCLPGKTLETIHPKEVRRGMLNCWELL